MRRFAAAAAAVLTAAGVLSVVVPGSAHAAEGTLILDGRRIFNPHGCYNSTRWPLMVANDTDQLTIVFQQGNCSGRVEGAVAPGQSGVFNFGSSIYIP